MEPRLNIVTLGVKDLDAAVRFYRDGLGWPMSSASVGDFAIFNLSTGTALALYPRHLLAEDAKVVDTGGFGGVTLAQNVESRELVDAVLSIAVDAGGRLLKPAEEAEWGGYSGYFADPDGHPWEVAWNPYFILKGGKLRLPIMNGGAIRNKAAELASKTIIEDLDISSWNLSHEREFVENLYVGRFNYFLLVFSLIITAGFANNFTNYRSVVFYIGAMLLLMIWLLLYRAYKKHDQIISLIFKHVRGHPAYQTQILMKLQGYRPAYTVSKLMGVYIPWFCIVILMAAGVLIHLNILK